MMRLPLCLCSMMLLVAPLHGQDKGFAPAAYAFFETSVRPVLANRCFECHGARKHKGDLRLDSLAAILQGGESGPAIVPGQPGKSLLVEAINHASLKMPPENKLKAAEIAALTDWIKMGAPWSGGTGHQAVRAKVRGGIVLACVRGQ